MNIRHTIVLALVGWYMMMPPLHRTPPDPNGRVDLKAPVGEWNLYTGKLAIGLWTQNPSEATVFQSHQECEAEVEKARGFARKLWLTLRPTEDLVDLVAAPWSNAKCIAGDDPRLKEK